MTTTCFVTYEIHPTTWGGCGVLLRHAAEHLLRAGQEIVFLLDIPRREFDQFVEKDRFVLPHAERVRAYHADTLCQDCSLPVEQAPGVNAWKSVRFAHAVEKVIAAELRIDFVEFFEYCGVSYYSLTRRLFGRGSLAVERAGGSTAGNAPVLGSRLHNSLELIDDCAATRFLDRERYQLYALERAGLRLSEAVLTPTRTYFEKYYRDRYALPDDQVVVSQSPKVPFPKVTRRPNPSGPFTIAYVGRMFAFKGVDQLVRAAVELFRRRPALDCAVDIIGPDAAESPLGSSYAEYLRSLIPGAMRDRFRFAGHLSHEQIAERLNDALFAVFPNKFESFCYALHETYDARVPLVVNDIAGIADFFHHEKNCLVYDGRTDSLVSAMERMIDDSTLRDRLTRPYAVADDPLGKFYAAPKALRPLTPTQTPAAPEVLAVVLAEADIAKAHSTIDALKSGKVKPARTICLIAAPPDAEETFWWMGRSWHVRDEAGHEIASADVRTTDAITILRAGDRPSADWLAACTMALTNDASCGFAATWSTVFEHGQHRIEPTTLDLVPETYPFEQGPRLTRAVIRTRRGLELADLLDQNLGNLGEIGLVWSAVERFGAGAALDEPLIELNVERCDPAESSLLKYLIARYGGVFAQRLKLYAAIVDDRVRAAHAQVRELATRANIEPPAVAAAFASGSDASPLDASVEYKIRMADELGGSLLAKMAWTKMRRRLMGKAPRRPR